jgi:hypothetical protein
MMTLIEGPARVRETELTRKSRAAEGSCAADTRPQTRDVDILPQRPLAPGLIEQQRSYRDRQAAESPGALQQSARIRNGTSRDRTGWASLS